MRQELLELVNEATFANLGFIDGAGMPNIRRVFCTWHIGIKTHLISTNTSSGHVQSLLKDDRACLYFEDSNKFRGLCLTGRVIVHFEPEYRELLWHEEDVQYYPNGVTDEDYCVLEFIAESARYYYNMNSGNLTEEELSNEEYGTTMHGM